MDQEAEELTLADHEQTILERAVGGLSGDDDLVFCAMSRRFLIFELKSVFSISPKEGAKDILCFRWGFFL
jgi:hypothetical protein